MLALKKFTALVALSLFLSSSMTQSSQTYSELESLVQKAEAIEEKCYRLQEDFNFEKDAQTRFFFDEVERLGKKEKMHEWHDYAISLNESDLQIFVRSGLSNGKFQDAMVELIAEASYVARQFTQAIQAEQDEETKLTLEEQRADLEVIFFGYLFLGYCLTTHEAYFELYELVYKAIELKYTEGLSDQALTAHIDSLEKALSENVCTRYPTLAAKAEDLLVECAQC